MSVSRYHLTSFDYYCTTAESEDFFSFFSSLMTTKNSESFSRRNLALSKEKDHWFNAILALGLLFSNDLLEYYDFNSGMYYSYPRILQFSIIEVSLDCIQKSCERSELYFVFCRIYKIEDFHMVFVLISFVMLRDRRKESSSDEHKMTLER